MPNKALIINAKTQLVTDIMALAYLSNQTSQYGISVEYHDHVDSLRVAFFDRKRDDYEWDIELLIYVKASSGMELQRFKTVMHKILDGIDISNQRSGLGFGGLQIRFRKEPEDIVNA